MFVSGVNLRHAVKDYKKYKIQATLVSFLMGIVLNNNKNKKL